MKTVGSVIAICLGAGLGWSVLVTAYMFLVYHGLPPGMTSSELGEYVGSRAFPLGLMFGAIGSGVVLYDLEHEGQHGIVWTYVGAAVAGFIFYLGFGGFFHAPVLGAFLAVGLGVLFVLVRHSDFR